MIITFAVATHVGSVRHENQDAVVVDGWVGQSPWLLRSGRAVVRDGATWTTAVVDGMGGYAGGSTAALLAAASLSTSLRGMRPQTDGVDGSMPNENVGGTAAWATAYQRASEAVTALARQVPPLSQMGATAASLVVHPQTIVVSNIGDARVYRLWRGYFTQLSEDDRSFDGSTVTQALGPHLRGVPDPHLLELPLTEPLRMLLCTDGLWDVASEASVEGIVREESAVDRAVRALVDAALCAGGRDNITVVLADLVPEPGDGMLLEAGV